MAETLNELPKYTCGQCGNTWTPRVPNPVVCPVCKKRNWREKKQPNSTGGER